nr:centromere/kinetochore protein zw10 homolog [Leptinotarsa decemlineata]
MSFLANVLSSAEEVELEEINKKVPELKLTVEDLKMEIVQYIENVYVKYSFRPKQNKELLQKAYMIEEEIKLLKKKADTATKKDLIKSNKELEEHIDSLEYTEFSIHVVSKLCEINGKLTEFESFFDAKEYVKCAQLLYELEETINGIPSDERVDVIHTLISNIVGNKTMLLNELNNVFGKHVIMNNKEQTTTLEIRKNTEDLNEALLALFHNTSVAYPLHTFAKSLWDFFLVPAIDNKLEVDRGENDKFRYIQTTGKKGTNYLDVFASLKTIFEFLRDNFNFKLNDNLTTLEYIGIDIRDNLSELLIKHCLEDTIPSTVEGLQQYKIVIENTEKLEETLRECKIFVHDTTSIVEYANNIDILFINKKCQEYLTTSQEIMKKDMHDLAEVGEPYDPENPIFCSSEQFLQCSVSKSVIELLDFAKKIMEQTLTASDVCAGRLFCTLQNIFYTYGKFVPEFHKKLLQTIPQQVALFHNNCLYIGHTLTAWNKTYCLKMAPSLNIANIGFSEEAHQLELIASETFSNYVKGQLKQINDIMSESGLEGGTLEEIQPVTEKSVRQCIRQQELLKTVWKNVLPYPLYNKTLGEILNSLCVNFITSIIKYEDISLSSAEQLVEIIKIILNRGSKLFTDPKEVSLYVASWYKLNELNFVLSASLLDINDRWADGKGPLAIQFKPNELKSLIRALFQNTDRRSAVLAKIL